jgi:hypothetical protein
VKTRALLPLNVGETVVAVASQAHTHHADPAVAQADQVATEVAHGRPIIDPDVIDAIDVRLVTHHDRQWPLQHRGQAKVIIRYRVHDEAVHHSPVHRDSRLPAVSVRARRHQQQSAASIAAGHRQSLKEPDRCGILKGIGQRLGEK